MNKIETMEKFWLCAENVTEGYVFAMLTDEIVWKHWPVSQEEQKELRQKEEKLLDIRIFNKEKELRMFRGDIGRKFYGRMLEDTDKALQEQEYFDEEQYLDIDDQRSPELFAREKKVRATGGGCYELPLSGFADAKVKIRNYLGYYEESGQAYVRDWRLMEVFQEKRGKYESCI